MAKTNELLSAVENKSALVVNSVSIEDDAIIIRFTSDWTDKKKTMPLTEKGLAIKDWLAKIFASDEFDNNSIWSLVKEGGRLAECCTDLAKEAKARQAKVDAMFDALGLWDPIDAL